MTTRPDKPTDDPLAWVIETFHRAPLPTFKRDYPNIIFTESGQIFLGNCLGLITGVRENDEEAANWLAESFVRTLEGLKAQTSELSEIDDGHFADGSIRMRKLPTTIIQLYGAEGLSCDVLWFRYAPEHRADVNGHSIIEHGIWKDPYISWMNGGFIFHGWNRAENHLMNPKQDYSPWGIHT